jgi:hypothetical protein
LLKIRSAAEQRTELARARSPSSDWLAQGAIGEKLREVPLHALRTVSEFIESRVVDGTPSRCEGEQKLGGRLVEAYEVGENVTRRGSQVTTLTSV